MGNHLSRFCSKCEEFKPYRFFYAKKRPSGSIGYSAWCKKCHSLDKKEWKKKNPDKLRANYLRNKPNARWARIKSRYGISREEYVKLSTKQNNCCAICGANTAQRKNQIHLLIDHCHRTNKIRGLLCNLCNVGIANFRDNPVLLKKAIIYLKRGSKCQAPHKGL